MKKLTERYAATCDLMALAGKGRWKEWGDHMRDNLSQNTKEGRVEFRVMLTYLRIDVNQAFVEHRAAFTQSANWETSFSKLVKMHVLSSWHLFALGCMPLLMRCGFHRVASSVPAHVVASYEGVDLRVISALQVA